MTNQEKQDLWNYIWNNTEEKTVDIQDIFNCSSSTVRKYKRIIKKLKEKKSYCDVCEVQDD